MIAKMLCRKTHHCQGVLEPWLGFHIRVCRDAKSLIASNPENCNASAILQHKKISFAGHVARFGINNREEHLVKQSLLWRNSYWWKIQTKQIVNGLSDFTHPRLGFITRWENQFPRNWITEFSIEDEPPGS